MSRMADKDILVTVPAPHDLIAAWPEQPQQLFLLFHGLGQKPAAMLPLARRLVRQFPLGVVASIAAPHAWEEGDGFQWYSPRGVTEDNRPQRIQPALQEFVATVQAWQHHSNLGPECTALVCYSQAAIVGLEAVAQRLPLCARLFAIAGRFARLPAALPDHTTLHWLHGEQDKVIARDAALAAADRLTAIGADFSLDLYPEAGHELTEAMELRVLHLLQNHVPQRLWREAMSSTNNPPLAQDPDSGATLQ